MPLSSPPGSPAHTSSPPATREQIDRWVAPTPAGHKIGALGITEPDGGSDVGGLRTTARRDGEDYIVNGSKTYITSGVRADFVTTAVRTGGQDNPGSRGLSLMVIEKGMPGFEVSRRPDKMGWRCSDTAELSFTDVRVPASHLIGPENAGFLLIGSAFLTERIALAAQAYSQAQRCLDLATQWCRERTTFGAPLISRQSVQNTLVEMAGRIDIARTYTRALIDRSMAGEDPGSLIPAVCFAKNNATRTGEWVASEALQLFGGMGYMTECEVERQYRTCASSVSAVAPSRSSTRWPHDGWDSWHDNPQQHARLEQPPSAGGGGGDEGLPRRDRCGDRQVGCRWRRKVHRPPPQARQAHRT
ncbi:acyl-CoA dehydrogenase family protein [Janibacter limosus]|uniref:Acyl-CoA dehydrogenase family protein n=1 Tax=Janibacter limosus TaxID=53458 RepID=A0AC61U7L8_9MICO|nr:acyl-CoA dehydrogenase family protein [Janibacter limosus]UUZ45852.1 acyl-CoA dehydrogenase family protein [Janibacter limosus]